MTDTAITPTTTASMYIATLVGANSYNVVSHQVFKKGEPHRISQELRDYLVKTTAAGLFNFKPAN